MGCVPVSEGVLEGVWTEGERKWLPCVITCFVLEDLKGMPDRIYDAWVRSLDVGNILAVEDYT
jgi:hypothetical protein